MSSITDVASNVDITMSQVARVRLRSIRLQLIRLKLNSSVVLWIGLGNFCGRFDLCPRVANLTFN